MTLEEEEAEVHLRLFPREKLNVMVYGPEGLSLQGAAASVLYENGRRGTTVTRTFEADAKGRIEIPNPGNVGWFQVSGPGCAPTGFRPIKSSRPELRSGELIVNLQVSSRLVIHCKTGPEVVPGVGFNVRLRDRRGREAFRKHRDLHGAWPTEHPGWAEFAPSTRSRTTNLDGVCTFENLSHGLHRVEVSLDPAISTTFADLGLFETVLRDFQIPETTSIEIEVEVPWRIRVVAFDAFDKRPVRPLSISIGSRHVNSPSSRWHGFLSRSTETLVVSSPGYREARVPVGSANQDAQFVVDLLPDKLSTASFFGEGLIEAEGRELTVRAYQLLRDDGGAYQALTEVWAERIPLRLPYTMLPVPPFEGKEIKVEIGPLEVDGLLYHFTPSQVDWTTGKNFRFEVAHQPN